MIQLTSEFLQKKNLDDVDKVKRSANLSNSKRQLFTNSARLSVREKVMAALWRGAEHQPRHAFPQNSPPSHPRALSPGSKDGGGGGGVRQPGSFRPYASCRLRLLGWCTAAHSSSYRGKVMDPLQARLQMGLPHLVEDKWVKTRGRSCGRMVENYEVEPGLKGEQVLPADHRGWGVQLLAEGQ